MLGILWAFQEESKQRDSHLQERRRVLKLSHGPVRAAETIALWVLLDLGLIWYENWSLLHETVSGH